jgi:hypothetical protein
MAHYFEHFSISYHFDSKLFLGHTSNLSKTYIKENIIDISSPKGKSYIQVDKYGIIFENNLNTDKVLK